MQGHRLASHCCHEPSRRLAINLAASCDLPPRIKTGDHISPLGHFTKAYLSPSSASKRRFSKSRSFRLNSSVNFRWSSLILLASGFGRTGVSKSFRLSR